MYQASRSLERKTLESAIKFIRKKDIYIYSYIHTNKQNAKCSYSSGTNSRKFQPISEYANSIFNIE